MNINDIAIIFTSIILEAIPFVILGVIISGIIQEFVTDEFFEKIIPKNPILGSIVGVIMGFFIPSCDCAVIPVARRLIKKGVPLNVCVSFMLASPIVNPITIISTIYAFRTTLPNMIFYRVGFGVIIAIITGVLTSLLLSKNDIFKKDYFANKHSDNHLNQDNCDCGCQFTKGENHFWNIVEHSKEEFLTIMKFLIVGAAITTVAQVLLLKFNITALSSNTALQILIMMILAYVISLCSTADAFIAKNFLYVMSNNSILAFLILGAMIDIKNTLVLSEQFSKKFIGTIISITFISIFVATVFLKI